jgi:hypothetical protein
MAIGSAHREGGSHVAGRARRDQARQPERVLERPQQAKLLPASVDANENETEVPGPSAG